MTKKEQKASLIEIKAIELFNETRLDELYELYLENRKLFLEMGIAQEQIIKMLKAKDNYQLLGYLKNFEDENEIQEILDSYEIPPSILINNLKSNAPLYFSLKDNEKICVIPRKINEHNDDVGVFLKNVFVKSLNQLITKCNTMNKIASFFTSTKLKENQLNDILQSLINSYLSPLDLTETADQPRVGNSNGTNGQSRDSGNADIIIKIDGQDVVVECLWLNSLDKTYLDAHLDKVFDYSTYGKLYFIVIYYDGSHYSDFKKKVYNYLNNIDNKDISGSKHKYLDTHHLKKISKDNGNNSLDSIILELEDSKFYVFNANLKKI
ncbi:MAG: hypothetical protein UHO11_04475 [Treponema sp.]|nr:hypothetical protein [Treponema sp.]